MSAPDIEVLKSLYAEGKTALEISEIVDLSEKSVIARLSNAGVYKKKVYLTKQGKTPIRKAEYVERIADALGKDVELFDSLEKANKQVLEMLLAALDAKHAGEEEFDAAPF
jgi:hypothetical protein